MVGHHIITGTLVYAITRCVECQRTWEQPGLNLRDPGWVVCPHCNAAAPAEMQPVEEDREHDWHGAFCATCGADEASSFADRRCPGFPVF